MKAAILLAACIAACFAAAANAFAVVPAAHMRDSSFVARAQLSAPAARACAASSCGNYRPATAGVSSLRMGKVSKFGVFSPAVIAAKVVLGEGRLNKIRGKVIALHSQIITEYCEWVGAPSRVRGLLIKKAKQNGDTLGFLW